MPSKNDITGDTIQSKSPSKAYEDNYDRIFGNKNELKIARETSKTFSMEQD